MLHGKGWNKSQQKKKILLIENAFAVNSKNCDKSKKEERD